MLEAALKRDISYYRNKNEDFSTRILHDAVNIANDISVGFPMLFLNVVSILIVIGLMFYMNFYLTLIPLLVVPIFIIVFNKVDDGIRKKYRKMIFDMDLKKLQ